MYYFDKYGRYEIEAEQEFDNKIYQWRKYNNSAIQKRLGGMYANWCEDGRIKFYRNSYIRDRAFPKFVDNNNDEVEAIDE